MADKDATNIGIICFSLAAGILLFCGVLYTSKALQIKHTLPGAVVASLLSTAFLSNALTKSFYNRE